MLLEPSESDVESRPGLLRTGTADIDDERASLPTLETVKCCSLHARIPHEENALAVLLGALASRENVGDLDAPLFERFRAGETEWTVIHQESDIGDGHDCRIGEAWHV